MRSLSVFQTDSDVMNEAIRQKAAEVVARSDYQLEQGLDETSRSLLMIAISWIIKPFIWLFDSMDGLPTVVKMIVIVVLVLILVGLIAHIIYSILSAIRGAKRIAGGSSTNRDRPLDPVELEELATAAAHETRYVEAIRLLLKAALVRIEQAEEKKFRAGITNREILKRYRTSSLEAPLARIIDLVDRKWYGTEQCEQTDFDACVSQHRSICETILRRNHAVRA